MSINLVNGFTLTISDPNNILGSNQTALVADMNFVVTLLSTYLTFSHPLDLQVTFAPASANPYGNTDGLMPSAPAWINYNGQETLAALVKAQSGVDPNGATADAGFTMYPGNDGTLKNYGSPFWFDPNPMLGIAPSIPTGSTDFVGVAVHELLHCFGFASWPAMNAPWNQHLVSVGGSWYYSSSAVNDLLGGMLPVAPGTTADPTDHIGNQSLSYQPIRSDLMYQFGNYAANRLDIGQLDLLVLRDLGWSIRNYQSLPLVDTLDSRTVIRNSSNDSISIDTSPRTVLAGDGDDTVTFISGTGNGNDLIDGGNGTDTFNATAITHGLTIKNYGADYLMQDSTGANSVSLLHSIEKIITGAGNDVFSFGAALQVTGGAGADKFMFDASAVANAQAAVPAFDRITDYHFAEGDQIDLSALLAAAYNHGGGQPVPSLVRAAEDSSGTFASLQIDPDGAANGVNFVTIARLDGMHLGDTLNVILDAAAPAGSSISVMVPVFPVPVNDFNGDGMSDIVWRNDAGVTAIWDMNDGATLHGNSLGTMPANWTFAGTGDFNGDHKSDLLWRNDAGVTAIWDMNDGTVIGGGSLGTVPVNWHIAGTGDFNGDHKTDILWRNDVGLVAIWDMNDTTSIGGGTVATVAANWHIADTGDYNGDGKSDILLRNDAGVTAIWDMNDSAVIGGGGSLGAVPANWHIIV